MKLKELSRLLNLSATTVSRALNGYPEVNAETRARVLAAARSHGYVPNQMARRLATGRSMAIGHVVPLAAHQVINPLFAEFLLGAGEAYSEAGYDMVISIVPAHDEAAAYEAMARHHKVDGAIVHGPLRSEPRIALLRRLGLPFLIHGRDARPEAGYGWMDIDNEAAFREAAERAIALGHRRIALLNGIETMSFAWRRRRGFEAALAAAGLAPDPRLMRSADMTEPFGHAAAREMLALAEPPTLLLCSAITIALGALRAVRELGLEPGRDVSILTHDDDLSFLPNRGEPPLFAATRSSIRAAGKRSAELLIARIGDPELEPARELWPVEFVPGCSLGPCPGA